MAKPQPQEPHGLTGRIFGKLMEQMNAASYAAAEQRIPDFARSCVEIGFGTGALADRLARRGLALVAGVDPSELMVETATRRMRGKAVDLRLGTAEHLPWGDASFDVALALHSFQFWSPPEAGIAEARRVLVPGGRLILVLRKHGGGAEVQWLPNPLSRVKDEVGAAIEALNKGGFDARSDGMCGSSPIVIAEKPV